MNSEKNTCSFCRAERGVARQYLHAKNKPSIGDGFAFIYYCAECELKEVVLSPEEFNKWYAEAEKRGYEKGYASRDQEVWKANSKLQ